MVSSSVSSSSRVGADDQDALVVSQHSELVSTATVPRRTAAQLAASETGMKASDREKRARTVRRRPAAGRRKQGNREK